MDSLQQVADQKLIQQHVAGPIAAALVQPVQQGSSSVEASSLLSSLVKHFGADVAAGGGTSAKSSQGHTTGSLRFLTFCNSLGFLHWYEHLTDPG